MTTTERQGETGWGVSCPSMLEAISPNPEQRLWGVKCLPEDGQQMFHPYRNWSLVRM